MLFLTFFMLLSSQRLRDRRRGAVQTLTKKKITVQILDEIAGQVQHFLLILLLTGDDCRRRDVARVVGIRHAVSRAGGAWPQACSTPSPTSVRWSSASASAQSRSCNSARCPCADVAGVAMLITSLEGFVLTPLVQGKAAKMNSVAVFVGILFWSWMWGPIGLLLAVPLTTVVKVVCDHVEELQPVGRLLGE